MAGKIGLEEYQPADEQLINQLLDIMHTNNVDYTIFFRQLAEYCADNHSIRDQFIDRDGFDAWAEKYDQRLQQQNSTDAERRQQMQAANPKYVLRNYMAQAAIEQAHKGDYTEVNLLLEILQAPFAEHPQAQHYAGLPPDWAEQISVSCSS